MPSSVRPYGLQPARLLCPWHFSWQEYWSRLTCPPPGNLQNPGIEPRSPTLQTDSLHSEPPEKCKNTGVGSLSLLQGIFPTKESNQGLLHCRWIFYQLSYQGNPVHTCPIIQMRKLKFKSYMSKFIIHLTNIYKIHTPYQKPS